MNSPIYVQRVGFTCGSFDLMHCGHVAMFEDCKNVCEWLIVAIQSDPTIDRPNSKNKPIQSLQERITQIKALRYVDEVITYDTEADLKRILEILCYDVRILGSDWKDKPFTGHDIPGHIAKCYFHDRPHNYSSSDIRERVYQAEQLKRAEKAKEWKRLQEQESEIVVSNT
jgi:glycerol-3-phosphate cytidylyltransferase